MVEGGTICLREGGLPLVVEGGDILPEKKWPPIAGRIGGPSALEKAASHLW